MDAVAEGELTLDHAVDREMVRRVELALVAVGGPVDQEHLLPRRDALTVELDVAGQGPGQGLDRRIEAEALVHGPGEDVGICRDRTALTRVLREKHGAVADQVGRGLVACHEEEHAHARGAPPRRGAVRRSRPR